MEIMGKVKGVIGKAKDMLKDPLKNDARNLLIYGDGELKKATLKYKSTGMGMTISLPVQFNPTDYKISRGVDLKEEEGINEEPGLGNSKGGHGKLATLSLKLTLDTATQFPSSVVDKKTENFVYSKKELAMIIRDLVLLTKTYPKSHETTTLEFIWGSMDFKGNLTKLDVSYKMFDREGNPVRAELDFDLLGEETEILNTMCSKPKESPDRTKVRQIQQRDELWMLAQEEYDDPNAWKEIAKANGILNPRKVDYTKGLKVPSL